MGHPYPETLPVDCLSDIVSIVRNGMPAERRSELVNCGWTVVGFGLKLGFGDPNADPNIFKSVELPDDTVLEECQTACSTVTNELEPGFGAADDEKVGSIASVVALFSLAVQVFKFIREHRKK